MITLQNDKLIVRSPQSGDEKGLVEFSNRNKEFLYPTGLVQIPDDFTEEKWQKYIEQASVDFLSGKAVRLLIFKTTNQEMPIGKISFTEITRGFFQACYLGYGMDESSCGKGFMTLALKLSINYMFNKQNLHRIMANYLPDNISSARVLDKIGFVIEGTAKDYLMVNGEWRDHVLTSLTNHNWSNHL